MRIPSPKISLTTRRQRGRIALARPKWLRMVTLLCVLLVAGMGTAQAVHIHGDWLPQNAAHVSLPADASQGQGEEHCPLCTAMHSALPVTMHVVPAPVLAATQQLTARALSAPEKLWSFAMFSRPPPVAAPTLARHKASMDALRGVAAAG